MPTFIVWWVEEEGKISGREMRGKIKDYKWIFPIYFRMFNYFILKMMMILSNGDDSTICRELSLPLSYLNLSTICEIPQLTSFYMDEEMGPNVLLDLPKS